MSLSSRPELYLELISSMAQFSRILLNDEITLNSGYASLSVTQLDTEEEYFTFTLSSIEPAIAFTLPNRMKELTSI